MSGFDRLIILFPYVILRSWLKAQNFFGRKIEPDYFNIGLKGIFQIPFSPCVIVKKRSGAILKSGGVALEFNKKK